MTDCEKYGMCHGCDEDCPVLNDGRCEKWSSAEDYIEENGRSK